MVIESTCRIPESTAITHRALIGMKHKSCCTFHLPVGASAPTEVEIRLFLTVFTVRQVLAGPTV